MSKKLRELHLFSSRRKEARESCNFCSQPSRAGFQECIFLIIRMLPNKRSVRKVGFGTYTELLQFVFSFGVTLVSLQRGQSSICRCARRSPQKVVIAVLQRQQRTNEQRDAPNEKALRVRPYRDWIGGRTHASPACMRGKEVRIEK